MIVLENLNDNSFKMDGVPHTKVYELKLGADNTLSLVNIYDRADVLFSDQPVGNITYGQIFSTPAQLLLAFENLKKKDDAIEVPPKIFRALIARTGANAPTLSILRNTTGATITTSRTGVGSGFITFSSPVLTEGKTGVMANGIIHSGESLYARYNSPNSVFIITKSAPYTPVDRDFGGQLIHIEIEN